MNTFGIPNGSMCIKKETNYAKITHFLLEEPDKKSGRFKNKQDSEHNKEMIGNTRYSHTRSNKSR